MTDAKLTDEQLRGWLMGEYNPSPAMQMAAIDELIDVRADKARLEAALRPLAKQQLTEEMDEDQKDDADYEYAYNEMVRLIRALAQPAESGVTGNGSGTLAGTQRALSRSAESGAKETAYNWASGEDVELPDWAITREAKP